MSKLIVGENDLATENLKLAKQWHPSRNGDLTSEMVSANSHIANACRGKSKSCAGYVW